ncbi:MAG: DNA polymerase [Coprococcus sp.]
MESYFETYPGIKKFLDDAGGSCERTKGICCTLFGRRPTGSRIVFQQFYAADNSGTCGDEFSDPGTAADIMKIAMIAVDERASHGKHEIQAGPAGAR